MMNPERFSAWQSALQARDLATLLFAGVVGVGIIVWLVWGRKTLARRRLMVVGWCLLVMGLLVVGVVAT
jgi:hypothetical protein